MGDCHSPANEKPPYLDLLASSNGLRVYNKQGARGPAHGLTWWRERWEPSRPRCGPAATTATDCGVGSQVPRPAVRTRHARKRQQQVAVKAAQGLGRAVLFAVFKVLNPERTEVFSVTAFKDPEQGAASSADAACPGDRALLRPPPHAWRRRAHTPARQLLRPEVGRRLPGTPRAVGALPPAASRVPLRQCGGPGGRRGRLLAPWPTALGVPGMIKPQNTVTLLASPVKKELPN
uniref:uncharacterized protein LOC129520241 n=1 Tax=Nyctereutes procyonoides TaxID=34880 RepID=UPI002444C64B|nr:uncharacterized protein LOC129520241 [Nyctereutes procyonoides]